MEQQYHLSNADQRLLGIIWENEPVQSAQLCQLCERALGWKRTTTYTVLKRLCEKGLAKNEHACVQSLVTREEVQQFESRAVMERSFSGSLPQFIAAFMGERRLSGEEAAELQALIDHYREG